MPCIIFKRFTKTNSKRRFFITGIQVGNIPHIVHTEIANATGKKVVAGPIEATAVGNAMVQLKSLGCISDEKENARILRATFEIADYMPQDTKVWDEKFEQYRKITKK